jgi:hypothetical protein
MRTVIVSSIGILLLLGTASCAWLPGSSAQQSDQASMETPQTIAESTANQPVRYDFNDIVIPQQMDLEPDESVAFEVDTSPIGALVFSGRVEPVSLFEFFRSNMPSKGWTLVSYLKYQPYLMIYRKANRMCILHIKETTLSTKLNVWVTPRIISGQSTGSNDLQEERLDQ